jgi:hypothetical protein
MFYKCKNETITEGTEKAWRSEACAFITGFSLGKEFQRNLGIRGIERFSVTVVGE